MSAVEALGRMQARRESVLLRIGIARAAHDAEAQGRVRALIHLDPGRALLVLERYARQITDKSWAPRLRGQALLELGRTDAARAELERAARREKKRDDLLWLAHFYLESREPGRAAQPIQRALERSGHDAVSLLSQAVMLWQENRREAALEALARAQERARHVLYLDDLRYEHFWRTAALTALQEMLDAQAAQERPTR
jgi:predicted negative regulator of RcsB-dependent stress response